ncbi:MAG: glycosyltransferase family 9 protein, partial [Planctomycetota bacterium]
ADDEIARRAAEPFTLTVPDEARSEARELIGAESWIALCPGTRWESKLWTPERWAELADWIAERYPELTVALCGAPSEAEDVARIAGLAKNFANLKNLAGAAGLWTSAAVFAGADAVVALDSAPLHLAAAVGTPTVSMFGPTDPGRVAPRGHGHTILRREELDCLVCYERRCPLAARECLPGITAETVGEALEAQLAR